MRAIAVRNSRPWRREALPLIVAPFPSPGAFGADLSPQAGRGADLRALEVQILRALSVRAPSRSRWRSFSIPLSGQISAAHHLVRSGRRSRRSLPDGLAPSHAAPVAFRVWQALASPKGGMLL